MRELIKKLQGIFFARLSVVRYRRLQVAMRRGEQKRLEWEAYNRKWQEWRDYCKSKAAHIEIPLPLVDSKQLAAEEARNRYSRQKSTQEEKVQNLIPIFKRCSVCGEEADMLDTHILCAPCYRAKHWGVTWLPLRITLPPLDRPAMLHHGNTGYKVVRTVRNRPWSSYTNACQENAIRAWEDNN